MLSDKLRHQTFALKILQAHRRLGRVAHTYLITGHAGSGQEDLAMAFACGLNDPDVVPLGDVASASSQKIVKRLHPDVYWLGLDEKASSIKIEEVREAIRQAGLKPYEGRYKVMIIVDAGRLTLEAQNALLKTLEEPPPQTVFCLLTHNKGQLLDTIRSRSFEIKLAPPREDPQARLPAPLGFGEKGWEDLLEEQQGRDRVALAAWLGDVMLFFRDQMRRAAQCRESQTLIPVWLEAVERLRETQEAIDSNVNQKLALTRLALHFKRLMPTRRQVLL